MTVIVDRRRSERREPGRRPAAGSARCATAAARAWRASSRRSTATSTFAAVQVVVHVDGGARGNPGPPPPPQSSPRPTGACSTRPPSRSATRPTTSPSTAACCSGSSARPRSAPTEVEVVNDSELVAKQVDGSYKVKQRRPAAAPRAGDRRRSRGFERWSIRSVPRAQNAAADALVNRALDGEEIAPAAPLPETRHRRRHRLRDLPADRRPAAAAAAAHAGRARRAAVHRRPPGLRALVQADPARAGRGARRAGATAARTSRRRGCGGGRGRAAAARPARRARDDGPGGLPGVPRPARARVRLPVAPVPRDRVALGRARDVAGRRRPARGPVALRGVLQPGSSCPTERDARLAALAELYRDHATTRCGPPGTRSPSCWSTTTRASRAGATTTR